MFGGINRKAFRIRYTAFQRGVNRFWSKQAQSLPSTSDNLIPVFARSTLEAHDGLARDGCRKQNFEQYFRLSGNRAPCKTEVTGQADQLRSPPSRCSLKPYKGSTTSTSISIT